MTALPVLTNQQARRLFLARHGLSEAPLGPARGAALLDVIRRLGFVQLDSINTVARAHDLILFARRPRFRPKDLKSLYEKDRALFEHWTHDAAVVPMEYYPWWHMRRQRDAQKLKSQWRNWRRGEFEAQLEGVIERIREEGPLCSSDVGREEKRGTGGWWDWHPSKTALEYLWRSGTLCVVGRRGFQKHYDLTERVIEQHLSHETNLPDEAQTIDWCCNGALDRLGFATPKELAAFWDHVKLDEAKAWCSEQIASGHLVTSEIEMARGGRRSFLMRPETLQDPALHTPPSGRLRVLSPFDPALRDRVRAERLFGFAYRIEIFVPEPKRTFGYYVFPILEGERLVGRVDMKALRDQNVLSVTALWPEHRVKWGTARARAFESELERITRLAGVQNIRFEPGWLRDPVVHQQ